MDVKATGKRFLASIVVLIVLHLVALLLFVFTRHVDGDEGFYLSSAQHVSQGAVPYVDFLFPQMPFLPNVLAPLSGHGLQTLYYSRLASVLISSLTLLIFTVIVLRYNTDRRLVFTLIALYASSGLLVAWHSVAKTYAWTDLFLMAGLWAQLSMMRTRLLRWVIVSGLCLGMAVGFRLVFVALIPLYGYVLFVVFQRRRTAAFLAFVASLAVVLIPIVIPYTAELPRFYFNNLGFHFVRNQEMTVGEALWHRCYTVLRLCATPQVLVLVALLLHGAFHRRTFLQPPRLDSFLLTPTGLSLATFAIIVLVYLLPSPIHQQYFEQAVPFAILAVAPVVAKLFESEERFLRPISNRSLRATLAVLYLIGFSPYVAVYVITVRDRDTSYRLETIREVSSYLAAYPGRGPLFSEWVGFPVFSRRESIPGVEFIGFDYPMDLDDQQKRYYHLPVNGDLKHVLASGTPALYVTFDSPDTALTDAVDRGYRLARSFDRWHVYVRRGDSLLTQ